MIKLKEIQLRISLNRLLNKYKIDIKKLNNLLI